MKPDQPPQNSESAKPDRAALLNIVVLVVVTVSMIAMPIRKAWLERNEVHRLAEIRGRVITDALEKNSPTNRESATAILRTVDPTLELASLPGLPRVNDGPMIAWAVVDLPREASREMPLLLSRNIAVTSLAQLTGRVADVVADEPPFGTNAVLLITRGGRPILIQAGALQADWREYLAGEHPTNRVLRP